MRDMKMTIRYVALLFLVVVQIAYTQNIAETITKTGTTSASFIKIGVDARAASMGNAFTAMTGDVSSIFWNPAGIAYIHGVNMLAVNNSWIADIDINYAAIGINTGTAGVIGFSLNSMRVPRDKVRTVENPEGTGEYWEAGGLAINLSYARRLTDHFSLGGNVKMIHENIWHSSSTSFAGDLGVLFVTPFFNTRLGASITNYGGKMQLDGRDLNISVDPDPDNIGTVEYVDGKYSTEAFPLPLLFRVGISGDILNQQSLKVTYALDAMHPNDNTEVVNTGIEIGVAEMFFLRAGYANLFRDSAEEGLSFGAGINYRIWGSNSKLRIDYSYTDFGRFNGVKRVSLGMNI